MDGFTAPFESKSRRPLGELETSYAAFGKKLNTYLRCVETTASTPCVAEWMYHDPSN